MRERTYTVLFALLTTTFTPSDTDSKFREQMYILPIKTFLYNDIRNQFTDNTSVKVHSTVTKVCHFILALISVDLPVKLLIDLD